MVSEHKLACSYSPTIHSIIKLIQTLEEIQVSIDSCFAKIKKRFNKTKVFFEQILMEPWHEDIVLVYLIEDALTVANERTTEHVDTVEAVTDMVTVEDQVDLVVSPK